MKHVPGMLKKRDYVVNESSFVLLQCFVYMCLICCISCSAVELAGSLGSLKHPRILSNNKLLSLYNKKQIYITCNII